VSEWSPALHATIDEARAVRGEIDGQPAEFVFGTEDGTRHTRGVWKKTLDRLVEEGAKLAAEEGVELKRFNLLDPRPKGISDKMARRHQDVQETTLHKSERMINEVHDRRRE
jgi:hypothetical protein